ncbi:hypothetical protein O0L34_g4981 [Tuta absoluta]|nr:hypothetical protein O0L34_g4981 [Tuta absoluta]
MSGVLLPHAPLSAAEALSSLLWQPYECRSPPLARSRTDGALVVSGGGAGGALAPARAPAQSPNGGRHACASYRATTPRHEMRLPVPAPAPLRKSDSVSVRVPGEPSRQNVSSVNIVQVQDAPSCNVNSAVQTERERSVVSAECQTEEPRRRRARRVRAPRVPELLESVPPPPYSTLPLPAHLPVHPPPPVPLHPPPPTPAIIPTPLPAPRFPFQPIPLR